jgi:hypothetical protein
MPKAAHPVPQKMNRRDGIQQWTASFVQHNMTPGALYR